MQVAGLTKPIHNMQSLKYEGLQVPTLEEVFKKFGKNNSYYIETKSPEIYPGMEKELLRLVDKYRINKDKLLVQSFSQDSLKIMHELDPSVKLVQLISYRSICDNYRRTNCASKRICDGRWTEPYLFK